MVAKNKTNKADENIEKVKMTAAEREVEIKSLKNGDEFDTSFFGLPIRMSVVIYILIALTIASMLLPFFSQTPLLGRSGIGEKYADIGWYKDKSVSEMDWNSEHKVTGWEVMTGKKIPHHDLKGIKKAAIPTASGDTVLKAPQYVSSNLYLSSGTIWGFAIPLLLIYSAIVLISREQWKKGGGYLRSALCGLVALAGYGYLFMFVAKLFRKNPLTSEMQSKIYADVFSKLDYGFYVGIGLIVLTIALSVIASFRVKAGKSYVSPKNKKMIAELEAKR